MRRQFSIDDEGYVCELQDDDSVWRVGKEEIDSLPAAVALTARARYAMAADVPVESGCPEKSNKTRVNLHATRAALEEAIDWQAQVRPTHAFATDGGRDVARNEKGYPILGDGGFAELVVTAACCGHTGGVQRGHVCCDAGDDNYLA